MNDSKGPSLGEVVGGCLGCIVFGAALGFLGLWLGYGVGGLLSPPSTNNELGVYIGTSEELFGAMLGGFLGVASGIALFIRMLRSGRQP